MSRCSSGALGPLVRRVDAGEVLQLAPPRLLVEPLGVALLGHAQRRVDEDLDELSLLDEGPDAAALALERGDEGRDHDQARVDHQLRHLADPADVLDAVGIGEAEILVQAVPDVVAVEQVGVMAAAVQHPLDEVGDRRLARPGEPREPDDAGVLAAEL